MKYFVLDTTVLVRNPKCLLLFSDNTLVIPIEVVDELVAVAEHDYGTGFAARRALELINSFRAIGDLAQGVKLQNGGIIKIETTPLPMTSAHDASAAVITTALNLKKNATCPVLLVSQDVATLIRAEAAGLKGFTLDGKVYESEETLFESYAIEEEPDTYNGFIVLQIQEDLRTAFIDILNGFVDYAKLKNYSLSLSLAALKENRIAFRFSPIDAGEPVSDHQVKADLNEYIKHVFNDEPLGNLPVLRNPVEHSMLLAAMHNRINMLQYNINLQRTTIKCLENLFETVSASKSIGIVPHITVNASSRVIDSSVHAVGNGNTIITGSIKGDVRIGVTYTEITQQVHAIDGVLQKISEEIAIDPQVKLDVERALLNIRDDLTKSKKPDSSRISRWLNTINDSLKTVALTKELSDAVRALIDLFT